jgi:hypothetical protein
MGKGTPHSWDEQCTENVTENVKERCIFGSQSVGKRIILK